MDAHVSNTFWVMQNVGSVVLQGANATIKYMILEDTDPTFLISPKSDIVRSCETSGGVPKRGLCLLEILGIYPWG